MCVLVVVAVRVKELEDEMHNLDSLKAVTDC